MPRSSAGAVRCHASQLSGQRLFPDTTTSLHGQIQIHRSADITELTGQRETFKLLAAILYLRQAIAGQNKKITVQSE